MKTKIYFFITSLPILLRMSDISENSCTENYNTIHTILTKIVRFMR